MKNLIATMLVTLLATAGFYHTTQQTSSDFERWNMRFNKFYHGDERIYRESIYNQNKLLIEQHNNRPDVTYTMGENQFMTLTHEEFVGLYLNQEPLYASEQYEFIQNDEILQEVDWRNFTDVKEQGACAAGWAFSITNQIEALYMIRARTQAFPSTQQIIDCDYSSSGCAGGSNLNAFNYVNRTGIVSSKLYPYNATTQLCQREKGSTWFDSFQFVGGTQQNLQSYLQKYPASVGVDASNWQFYSSGLFSYCSSNLTNHYAIAVGFDASNNWIVQNSFGKSWGEQGNIRLYPNNTCGILNYAYQTYSF